MTNKIDTLNNQTLHGMTIADAIKFISNDNFIMPMFQREFVWELDRIEKLWDSILQDYPINTFLFWKLSDKNVTEGNEFCLFPKRAVVFNYVGKNKNPPYDKGTIQTSVSNVGVLDGQQRLTSLYISLTNKVDKTPKHSTQPSTAWLVIELDKDRINAECESDDNKKKYDIFFTLTPTINNTLFIVADLLKDKYKNKDTRQKAIDEWVAKVPPASRQYANDVLNKLCSKIYDEKLINYILLNDSVTEEDAIDVFIRFNSYGKPLSKSKINMSTLIEYFPNAKDKINELKMLDDLHEFDSDFIIRTALTIYGKNAANSKIGAEIGNQLSVFWDDFKDSIIKCMDLLKEYRISPKRFINSWNVLIPIIYCIHNYKNDYKNYKDDLIAYLCRAIFFKFFQSGTTGKLSILKERINAWRGLTINMIEREDSTKDLKVTPQKIDELFYYKKDSRMAKEILYYLSLNREKNNDDHHIDHLHAQEKFRVKPPLGAKISDEEWMTTVFKESDYLPNLEFMLGGPNEYKSCRDLTKYIDSIDNAYKSKFIQDNYIPNVSWELKDCREFWKARKELLTAKIKELLKAN